MRCAGLRESASLLHRHSAQSDSGPRSAGPTLHRRTPRVAACAPTDLSGKETSMAQYGHTAQSKVKKAMDERKHGTLRSGSGKKVTSRKQAIAIGLSEARKKGAKVPKKRT